MEKVSVRNILIVVLLMYGGFYELGVAIAGLIMGLGVTYMVMSGKTKFKKDRMNLFCLSVPLVIFFLQSITGFYSIDWSLNVIGILRMIVVIFWLIICMALDNEKKNDVLNVLPLFAGLMVIFSIVVLPFEGMKAYLWQAGRLGGIFQYSNTCALFLLIAIIIGFKNIWDSNSKNRVFQIILLVINVGGLLLTGSRSIQLIAILWGIYKVIFTKKNRKVSASILIGFIAVIGLLSYFGFGQNMGRLTTMFTSNSTMWGRFLYYIDGIKMLLKHPLGLGYMGYYYIQGSEQSGVYTTMFVHNDFIQMGLDAGIIAMICLIAFVLYQFIKGKQTKFQKELLLIISTSCLVDFHLQYLSMIMIACLLLDMGNCIEVLESKQIKRKTAKRNKQKENIKKVNMPKTIILLTSTTTTVVCFVFLLAYGFAARGSYENSLMFFGANTRVLEKQLVDVKNVDVAKDIAESILDHNKYSVVANNNMAYIAAMKHDYDGVIQYKDRVLFLDKYNVEQYRKYAQLLDDCINNAINSGEATEVVNMLNKRKMLLPQDLAALEENTNPLAYKIKDKPTFTMDN